MIEHIELIRIQDLTADDVRLWSGFVAANPLLRGPYFDVRYIQAIGPVVPRAAVARLYSDGRVAGYFPYQKRGDVLLPMGAPLSDYHGVIAPPEVTLCFNQLLKATRARRLEFQGWIGPVSDRARTFGLTRRMADVSEGYEAWWAQQDAANHKFFKNVGRCQRNVEKDFGGFDFSWEPVNGEVLDWVVSLKRDQYRKTGMHDVFDCGWTRSVLDRLAQSAEGDFGLRTGVLRHEGRIVAAEISLVRGEDCHLWFPAYDPHYARYSVGILLTVAIIKNCAALGIKRFDFGTGGEDYKSPMTVAGGDCVEGDLMFVPRSISQLVDVASAAVPAARPRVDAARLSLRRRVKVIRATETGYVGWGRAVVSLLQRALIRLGVSRHA